MRQKRLTDWTDRVSLCLLTSIIHSPLCYFAQRGHGWTGIVKWSHISFAFTTPLLNQRTGTITKPSNNAEPIRKNVELHIFQEGKSSVLWKIKTKNDVMMFRWGDWLDEVTATYLICYPCVYDTKFDHHCTDGNYSYKTTLYFGSFNLKAYTKCPHYDKSTTTVYKRYSVDCVGWTILNLR